MDPLAPLFREWTLSPQRAGAAGIAHVVLENGGGATWRSRGADGLQLSYHWLDRRRNAIVWDGVRTSLPHVVQPGEELELDASVGIVQCRATGADACTMSITVRGQREEQQTAEAA